MTRPDPKTNAAAIAASLTPDQRRDLLAEDAPITRAVADYLCRIGLLERCGLTEDGGPAFTHTRLGHAVTAAIRRDPRPGAGQ